MTMSHGQDEAASLTVGFYQSPIIPPPPPPPGPSALHPTQTAAGVSLTCPNRKPSGLRLGYGYDGR